MDAGIDLLELFVGSSDEDRERVLARNKPQIMDPAVDGQLPVKPDRPRQLMARHAGNDTLAERIEDGDGDNQVFAGRTGSEIDGDDGILPNGD